VGQSDSESSPGKRTTLTLEVIAKRKEAIEKRKAKIAKKDAAIGEKLSAICQCKSSSGQEKRLFWSEHAAYEFMKSNLDKYRYQRVYKCPNTGLWHLSTDQVGPWKR